MAVVEMKSLLEAGVHFGHKKRDWNPKMKKYIYPKEDRSEIHIINLDISVEKINEALDKLKADGTIDEIVSKYISAED